MSGCVMETNVGVWWMVDDSDGGVNDECEMMNDVNMGFIVFDKER